jgi:ankyrin repeat protein
MLSTSRPKEYTFERHFIRTHIDLSGNELDLLNQLMTSFPYACGNDWIEKFSKLDTKSVPQKILSLAANAFYTPQHPRFYTVLGAAAFWGNADAVQKLIDMGAMINAIDGDGKLALHWAIGSERLSTIRCLLLNGTNVNIKSYENLTLLQYAASRGKKASAKLIEAHIQAYCRGALLGLFKHIPLPGDVCTIISGYLEKSAINITTNQAAYEGAINEMKTDRQCQIQKMG